LAETFAGRTGLVSVFNLALAFTTGSFAGLGLGLGAGAFFLGLEAFFCFTGRAAARLALGLAFLRGALILRLFFLRCGFPDHRDKPDRNRFNFFKMPTLLDSQDKVLLIAADRDDHFPSVS